VWPHLRAGLIGLAAVVALIDGCPAPPRDQVPAALRSARDLWGRTRQTLMVPFRPIDDLFRYRQQWKLFPVAERHQHRMWIEGRTGPADQWQLLYRPHDPEHALLASVLEYRRIRGAWNPGTHGPRAGYGPFVEWVAGELFAARPDLREIRVRMERVEVDPEEGRVTGLGQFDDERTRRRGGQ
jgi:hypothetical protein